MRGPIDYIIVGFDGNSFDGSILSSLVEPLENGTINLIALSLIAKDVEGNVTATSVTESEDEFVISFSQKYNVGSELVDTDDIDEVGELLDNNTSAGLLIVEQLWAKPLKKALIDANGTLLAEGRIHPEAANELESNEEDA